MVFLVGGVCELEGRFLRTTTWDDKVFKEGFRLREWVGLLGGVTEEDDFVAYLPPRMRVAPARITSMSWWVGVGRMP